MSLTGTCDAFNMCSEQSTIFCRSAMYDETRSNGGLFNYRESNHRSRYVRRASHCATDTHRSSQETSRLTLSTTVANETQMALSEVTSVLRASTADRMTVRRLVADTDVMRASHCAFSVSSEWHCNAVSNLRPTAPRAVV